MRKLIVFNHISLDGYFVGENGDSSWFHQGNDDEFNSFVAENSKGESELLFGRVTYDMMVSYWPTPKAAKDNPVVAAQMNKLPKIVFSKKMQKATWENTTLIKGDLIAEVKKLKAAAGPMIVIFGSGQIISQLSQARLVDGYQLIINPIALGKGRTFFEGMSEILQLKLVNSRTFKNGKVFLDFAAGG